MQIAFDIPHAFGARAIPGANTKVNAMLDATCKTIVQGGAKLWRPKVSKGPGQTQVTFDLPGAFEPDSLPLDNAVALQALLRLLVAINLDFLTRIKGQPYPELYNSGVIYGRTQVWDSIPALYGRKYGDCKSLSCALIADYAMNGEICKPVFKFVKLKDGTTNYHIYVQRANGQFEDPSKKLGMGNEWSYFQKAA